METIIHGTHRIVKMCVTHQKNLKMTINTGMNQIFVNQLTHAPSFGMAKTIRLNIHVTNSSQNSATHYNTDYVYVM